MRITELASMISTHPRIYGTAANSRVGFLPRRSARKAAAKGLAAELRIIREAIHDDWSGVVGIGEEGSSRMGRVGDVHPTVVPAAAAIRVAGKEEK